ncbi:phytanoyl-CoA dioxygenase family protein [Pseudoroseicyclus sp. CXY001]|uniref:phytanoyl-CoA dioxygenase family protein n=1 Tax=Pseudoroseicyclus sp. CXY001 TaxID=3242492 RepID=UPI00358DD354
MGETTKDTTARAAALVGPEEVAAFQQDGVIVLRGLFNAEELARLGEGIEANMAAPSERAIVASQPDDPGYFIEDFCNWQRIDAYREVIFTSPAAAAAGRLMEARQVRLYHDHLLVKEPNTRAKTPWHQDQPYYNIEGSQTCSMWAPLDPVPREATLEFVAGTHRGPWLMPRTFMTHEARWFPEGTLADRPDVDADREAFDIRGWALEPGDVVMFHMLALHAAGGAGSGRRRVLSVRFMGDDVRHAPRPWRTSPPFPGLQEELPERAPMEHPLFPLLWEAP